MGVFGVGDAALPAALEEVVRLRTTDLVGGGVMLRALVTLLFVVIRLCAIGAGGDRRIVNK